MPCRRVVRPPLAREVAAQGDAASRRAVRRAKASCPESTPEKDGDADAGAVERRGVVSRPSRPGRVSRGWPRPVVFVRWPEERRVVVGRDLTSRRRARRVTRRLQRQVDGGGAQRGRCGVTMPPRPQQAVEAERLLQTLRLLVLDARRSRVRPRAPRGASRAARARFWGGRRSFAGVHGPCARKGRRTRRSEDEEGEPVPSAEKRFGDFTRLLIGLFLGNRCGYVRGRNAFDTASPVQTSTRPGLTSRTHAPAETRFSGALWLLRAPRDDAKATERVSAACTRAAD